MESMAVQKNGITFEVDPHTDQYGYNRVTARLGELSATGKIPGCKTRAYPRIEFYDAKWLRPYADKRYDNNTFDFALTETEAEQITNWRIPVEPIRVDPEIEIAELGSTWGCSWNNPGEKTNYGFEGLPSSAGLWLAVASGDAVRQLLSINVGQIVKTIAGSYGGECRTIRVNVQELEDVCRKYWDKQNAAHAKQDRDNCHYCGSPATSVGFFGEPICPQCGG